MNQRPGRGGGPGQPGPGGGREGGSAPRTLSSDRRPRFSCRVTAARVPGAVGEEHTGGRAAGTEQVPLRLGGREGRMWSLSAPTSSRSLDNSLRRLRARRDSPAPTPGPREPRVPRASPRHARRPRPGAALGASGAGTPRRGMGPGGGPGLGSRTPPVPRAVRPGPRPPPPAPRPAALAPPRTAPAPAPPALPRVRSNGTFSSPLSFRPARNTHSPVRTRGQAGGGSPAPAGAQLAPQPGAGARQGPGAAGAGRRESGLRRAYLGFGGSSASGRGRSPPY